MANIKVTANLTPDASGLIHIDVAVKPVTGKEAAAVQVLNDLLNLFANGHPTWMSMLAEVPALVADEQAFQKGTQAL
jgi:hypothetical protein